MKQAAPQPGSLHFSVLPGTGIALILRDKTKRTMLTSAVESMVTIDDVSISYGDNGSAYIPLIFIHGFPFSRQMWTAQSDGLKDVARVITYDIRGFGKSTRGKQKASIDLYASDLVRLMESLKIEKAVVCGLSMGGYILMNAATRFPERFTGLILCDTQCIADSDENRQKRYDTAAKIKKEGLDDFASGFVKNVFFRETLEKQSEIVDSIMELIRSTDPETVCGALEALAERHETCTALKKVNIPTLIICGKEDTVTPLSQAELLFSTIKDSKLHVIENAGHMSNLEQPEIFNGHVMGFLSGLS
jgi:3-oxoadipate enol-lactonase